MPSSGSRSAVILLKHIGDILIFLMVILNGYSIAILVSFGISIQHGWMLDLKKHIPFWLCCLAFFLFSAWTFSYSSPSGIILMVLQTEGVSLLGWIPRQKYLPPLTQNLHLFWSWVARSLQNFLPFYCFSILTSHCIAQGFLSHFSEYLFRIGKSEIKTRIMTSFEHEEAQNDSAATSSRIKHQPSG